MLAERVCSSSAAGPRPRLTAPKPFVQISRNVHPLRLPTRSLQCPTSHAAAVLAPTSVSEPQRSQPAQPSGLPQQLIATPALQLAVSVFRAMNLVVERARTALAAALPKPDRVDVQVRDRAWPSGERSAGSPLSSNHWAKLMLNLPFAAGLETAVERQCAEAGRARAALGKGLRS